MQFHIMTLFPDMMKTILSESIIGRGEKKGYIKMNYYNFRDYAENKHRTVDDTPYGGGRGMLLTAPPLYNCHRAIVENINNDVNETGKSKEIKTRTVYMSPKGSLLTQKTAERLAEYSDIIVMCGHYEGVDERIIEEVVDEEISIGDYVLTGGELPCAILVDCVARLVEGVLSDPECHTKESISSGLLEYPQYTRPYDFMGRMVPDVLLSGNHANIEKWQKEQSRAITAKNRPDLFAIYQKEFELELKQEELKKIKKAMKEERKRKKDEEKQ